ncbi:MAG TPA: hypothetical protein ENH10_04090 [Bacteroidetes bacterium]|nr:hypothetical protein BMS3Bbin04_00363 [bacterium BMS3Bbin04]HDO65199.1 hypothetical protein [Bacteroidota bacterium]HEX04324.1 hypothetical protein [Bacteroidota bacterium]
MLWDITPERKKHKKTLWISLALSGIIMLFLLTVFPLLRVLVTSPKMPQALREVIVDIVNAKEKEQLEQKAEEEEVVEEEAPRRRETEKRLPDRQERNPMDRERMNQQDVALQQEINLNLDRQRSQRQDLRRDREMGNRRETNNSSSSAIIVPRGDASLDVGGGSQVSLGRSDRGAARTGRVDRNASRVSLDVGDGPSVPTLQDESMSGGIESDVSPIIMWMRENGREIPRDLKEPEYFNYQAGDLTTWVEYTAPNGTDYRIYLLGRDGDPPELKIFIVQETNGVLLTDIGARGSRSESFQVGRVLIRDDRMSLQMSQMSPGDPRAGESMDVFIDWWNSSN